MVATQKIVKRLKRTAIWLLILCSFFAIVTTLIGYYYENTVKHVIISELNKRLNTEIVVENVENDIQFSVFRDFPYASVTFYNVAVMDAIDKTQKKGKLLDAKSVSLQFNIWDIIFGEYKIKKIDIENAQIIIKYYNDGSDNYHFWKPSTDTSDTKFSLDLQKVVLNKVGINYLDYKLKQDFKAFAGDVLLKGKFSDNDFIMNVTGDLYVYQIKIDKDTYLARKGTYVDITLFVDNRNDYVEFREGAINIGKLQFEVLGKVSYANSTDYLDLAIEGKKMKLKSFINELPQQYKTYFSDYSFKGDFNFNAIIKGIISENVNPLFTASFSLKNGDIIRNNTNIALSGVSFTATYTNGTKHTSESSVLDIPSFASSLNDGSISGRIKIINFSRPEIDLRLSADLNLKDVFLFVKTDTIESASGRLKLNTEIKGVFENMSNFTAKDFISSTATGNLDLLNAEIIFKGSKEKLSNLNGTFVFNNNDIESKSFSGNYMSSDFVLKGSFRNILPYLFLENQNLLIDANIESNNIDIGELLETSSGKTDTVYQIKFPDNIQFHLAIKVYKASFNRFTATNITGAVALRNKQLIAKDVSLNAMNGRIGFTGLIDGSQAGKLLISCDASVNKVNIQRLFYEMENFGQNSIEDKNLKGVLTAKVQFASIWSTNLKVEMPTIFAKANIKIENGELNNYEPLNGLSKYLKNRDLSHVSFETLTNTIEIKDQLITIPQMEINSSAIRFNMSGTHGFDQTIDYQLGVEISQLRSKGPDRNDKVEDIGQIEDDGLHKGKYFFRITGTVDNPVYHTLDKKAYKANIKANLKEEKVTLKEILNREFNWFKKDTTLKKNIKDKIDNKYDFNVIWDEDEKENEEP